MKEVKFMRVAYERVSTAGQSTLRLEMLCGNVVLSCMRPLFSGQKDVFMIKYNNLLSQGIEPADRKGKQRIQP